MPKYLSTEHEERCFNDSGYIHEEGVVLDFQDLKPRPDTREYHEKEYALLTAYPSKNERLAEELAWAARSGPVYTIIKSRSEA